MQKSKIGCIFVSAIKQKTIKKIKKMTTLQVTQNANLGFQNFALTYLSSKNVKWGVEAASDYLDTVQDVDDFEKMLALFLQGKYVTTVEKMNDDCTWRNEIVKYEA